VKKSLIVVDMQNDYYPNGAMELVGILEAHRVINETINKFRYSGDEVIFIQHIASKDAPFFKQDSSGAEIYEGLDRKVSDKVFVKHYPNSFRDTGLHEYLQEKEIASIVICGAMTHMCIDTTVRAGYDLGYDIKLIANGCATKDLVFKDKVISTDIVHKTFLSAMDRTFCSVI